MSDACPEIACHPSLENAWLAIAEREFGAPAEAILAGAAEGEIAALSDAFTIERRPGFRGYGESRRQLAAYGLFFFPQTFVRACLALDECLAGGRWTGPVAGGSVNILDLGAGLGAAGFAVLRLLSRRLPGVAPRLHAVDRSPDSLSLLREVHEICGPDLWPGARVTAQVGDLRRPPPLPAPQWDVVVVSFALNEALEGAGEMDGQGLLRQLLNLVADGGLLLVIEPAMPVASERLEHWRDFVAGEDRFVIVAPCPHHAPCPLLRGGDAYCHEVRRWEPWATVAALNRRLFREIQFLKFSFLAVAAAARREADGRGMSFCRLVSAFRAQNGRFTAWGCAADGEVHRYEILSRGLSREARKALLEMERGSRLCWQGLRVLGDGCTWRSAGLPERVES